MSFRKKLVTIFLFVVVLINFSAVKVEASTLAEKQEKLQLLLQIQDLLKIVSELQTKLEALNDAKVEVSDFSQREPYQSIFFNFPHEAIYFVDNGFLVNSKRNNSIGKIDQELFDLFVDVVGRDEVKKHLVEWRIFHDRKITTGAYVESTNGLSDWIVGVNRELYRSGNNSIKHSFVNLFIHEYAHIILANQSDFIKNFEKEFWTKADKEHQSILEQIESEKHFEVTQSYYRKNINRFVSDYATISSDEDMAETFVYFIIENKPTTNTIRSQKILAFYQESDLIEIRMQVRANLRELRVL